MKFCEENLCSLVTQPANAFSSLIYVVIGVFLLFHKQKNKLLNTLPIIFILLGITSFLYHASFSFFFQIFDLASMFLLSSFLITYNVKRLKLIKSFYFSFLIVFLIQFISFLILKQKSGAVIFGIFILFSIALEIILSFKGRSTNYKYYLLAIIILIVALVLWILDIFQVFCDPSNHIINGHAIWHLINSISLVFIYKFYNQFKS